MALFNINTMISRQGCLLGKEIFGRQLRLVPSAAKWVTTTATVRAEPLRTEEGFWDKNKRLNRPMSPHLSIYKFQITSMLSITHRGTGMFMSGMLSSFALGMLVLPHNYAHYLAALEAMHFGGGCIFLLKLSLAWPFMYHFANGLRHLAWDMGKGFEIPDLYKSGYAVLGVSTVLAIIAAMM